MTLSGCFQPQDRLWTASHTVGAASEPVLAIDAETLVWNRSSIGSSRIGDQGDITAARSAHTELEDGADGLTGQSPHSPPPICKI